MRRYANYWSCCVNIKNALLKEPGNAKFLISITNARWVA
jgi:hypothetical protein